MDDLIDILITIATTIVVMYIIYNTQLKIAIKED